jgi:hypothetical protein
MEIERYVELSLSQVRNELSHFSSKFPESFDGPEILSPPLPGKEDHFIDFGLTFQQGFGGFLNDPCDMAAGVIFFQNPDDRNGPDYVTHGAEPEDENFKLIHV